MEGKGYSDIRYPEREEETLSNTFFPSKSLPLLAPGRAVLPRPRRWSGGARAEGRTWQGDRSPRWQERERGSFTVPGAEGSGQPSLSAGGCHPHIKRPAELLSARTQRGSSLPNRNRGGQGQGDVTSCALLLAHIAAGVSWAASSYRGSATARTGRVQGAQPSGARLPAGHNPQVSWVPQTQSGDPQV